VPIRITAECKVSSSVHTCYCPDLFLWSEKHGDLDTLLRKAKSEKKAVMLELGSVGCVPCDMMQPVIVRLAEQYRGQMEIYFVDVKEVPGVARQFGIHGIPTQVFLDRDGKEFHRHVGFYEYDAIVAMLKKAGI
jgi:thioredoxin 1